MTGFFWKALEWRSKAISAILHAARTFFSLFRSLAKKITKTSYACFFFLLVFRFGDLAHISKVKNELVYKLKMLMEEERRQLEEDLGRKLEELHKMKKRHQEEETRVETEIQALSEKLDNLTVPPELAQ